MSDSPGEILPDGVIAFWDIIPTLINLVGLPSPKEDSHVRILAFQDAYWSPCLIHSTLKWACLIDLRGASGGRRLMK